MTKSEYRFLLVQSIGFEPTDLKFSDEGNFKRISITQNISIDNKIFGSYMFEDYAYNQVITFAITGPNLLYITFVTKLITQ